MLVRAGVVASVAPPQKEQGASGPKRTKRVAKEKGVALHRMRHTAATRLNTVKVTPAVRKAIMGHGPGDVGEGYIHPDLTELRAALLESEQEMLRWAA